MPFPHEFRDSADRGAMLAEVVTPRFSFEDAASIVTLAPFLAREHATEAAHIAHHAKEAARCSGVHVSGAEPQPINPRTPEMIRYDAEQACARAEAYAASARGRFLLAIRSLQDLGYGAQAEAARNAMSRGFARPDEPASPKELACALKVLSPINHCDARTACLALAELVAGELKMAAE